MLFVETVDDSFSHSGSQLRYQYSYENSIYFWDTVRGSDTSGWRQETGRYLSCASHAFPPLMQQNEIAFLTYGVMDDLRAGARA